MATRDDWKLKANGCRGASWSNERFGANRLTATSRTPAFWMSRDFKDIRPLFFTLWYADECTCVLLYLVQ